MDMSLKVLIVDDDPIFVMMHRQRVRASSIAVNPESHFDGSTALETILSDTLQDDYLVFLDINMPIMDGWDLLNAIQGKPNSDKVHVVMVSSSVDHRDREKAKEYPQVIGFFEKALSNESCNQIKNNPAIAHFYN